MKRITLSLIVMSIVMIITSCSVPEADIEGNANSGGATPQTTEVQHTAITASTLDGTTMSDLFEKHNLTVINVWATWCTPCVGELPSLQKLSEEYADKGVMVYGILFDSGDASAISEAPEILRANNVTYTQFVNDGDIATHFVDKYDVTSLPTTFFVDPDGNVIDTFIGARSADEWARLVEQNIG